MTIPGSFALSKPAARREFCLRLLAWFDAHARDLPWRRTRDPYAIWVSEIMLQQTRVAAVIEKYAAFLRRFPTVSSLATAEEPDVLALWSGLGYYRRARMMHHAARLIVENHQAQLPPTAAELRELPGIGSYTSAAIASIAFGEAVAVVDGNVERVIMRLMGWGETAPSPTGQPDKSRNIPAIASPGTPLLARIQQQATKLLDPTRPGDFNQSMMELGATLCLPRRPLCLHCPVHDHCETRGEHPTIPRGRMRSEHIAYALIRREREAQEPDAPEPNAPHQVLLEQRPSSGTVMAGMWELPLIDPAEPVIAAPGRVVMKVRHAIMQTNYYVRIAAIAPGELSLLPSNSAERRWFAPHDLAAIPLTGLARKVLIAAGLFPQSASPAILPSQGVR